MLSSLPFSFRFTTSHPPKPLPWLWALRRPRPRRGGFQITGNPFEHCESARFPSSSCTTRSSHTLHPQPPARRGDIPFFRVRISREFDLSAPTHEYTTRTAYSVQSTPASPHAILIFSFSFILRAAFSSQPEQPSNKHHSNLLEKIRQASAKPIAINGRGVPEPIKRSVLV